MGQDLDASAGPAFVSQLARLSGTHEARLRGMTFDPIVINLTAIEQPRAGARRWILPKGSKNRRPTAAWLQFCPSCLQGDAIPYFRRNWRYAFITACHIHRAQLETHCPSCNLPFDFESYDIIHSTEGRIVPLTACSHCGIDLRSHCSAIQDVPQNVLRYQRALGAATRRGWSRVTGVGWLYSHQVLDVIHRLLRQLRSSRDLRRLLEASLSPAGPFQAAFHVPPGRFESWSVPARHAAIGWISWLLRGWPFHFVAVCTRFNVLRTAIHGHRGDLPYWFDRVLLERLYRPRSSRSSEEIAAAREAIRRAGQPDTRYNVRRWLGLHCCDRSFVQRLEEPSPEQFVLFAREEHRKRAHEERARRFPSRDEFEEIRDVLECARRRKKRSRLDLYWVWCAVLYHFATRCPIAALPGDFPKPATVRWYLTRWMACAETVASLQCTAMRRLVFALRQIHG